MSYDLGYRIPGAGGTFESEVQWRAVIHGLVRRAAEEVVRYGREATASWSTWNAVVAQSPEEPEYWLPVRDRAAAWSHLVRRDHAAFIVDVRRQTEKQREALKLPAALSG